MNKCNPIFSEYRQHLVIWMLLGLMPIVGMAAYNTVGRHATGFKLK